MTLVDLMAHLIFTYIFIWWRV